MSMFQSDRFYILDGATGTNMIKAGMPFGICGEKWIIEHPEHIIRLQREFLAAGSDIIQAPTFGANSVNLSRYGLGAETEKMNRELIEITKTALNGKAMIAGNLSSPGIMIAPFGDSDFSELVDIYYRQMCAQRDAGVDFVIAETLMSMYEARAAAIAAKRCEIPFAVSVTLEARGKTMFGTGLDAVIVTAQAMGAEAVGTNCSAGPVSMAKALASAAGYAKIPLLAKPNAGVPGEGFDIASYIDAYSDIIDAGANIIGGCCGTTPEYIKEIRKLSETRTVVKPTRYEGEYFANHSSVLPAGNVFRTVEADGELEDEYSDAEPGDGVLCVHVTDSASARMAGENSYACRVPVCFDADTDDALDTALFYCQGRALCRDNGKINHDKLEKTAEFYGAKII